MDATLELQQVRQNLSRMKTLTCILVGILPYVIIEDGVDAAGYGTTPDSGVCGGGGGGAGEDLESCRVPLLAAEFVGQTLSETAKKLRPVVLRSSAEVLAHVRDPYFARRLETDPNLRDKIARFFELQYRYYYELYGLPRCDLRFAHFFHAARTGTLRSELDKREVRDLMVMYLEVAAGDMGEDALLWGESERRHGRCSFSRTLTLFRRLVAHQQLLNFLRSRAHQFLFFTFYLTLLRKLAEKMLSHLPFDQFIIDRLRYGYLGSDLKDEQWRARMMNMLRIGNSVLTESPPSIRVAGLEPSAPLEASAPLQPSAHPKSDTAPVPPVPQASNTTPSRWDSLGFRVFSTGSVMAPVMAPDSLRSSGSVTAPESLTSSGTVVAPESLT